MTATDIERIDVFMAVRRAERPARRAAFSLALPLVAFLLVVFVAPILYLLVTAVGNPEIREVLPETLVALESWDGKSAPEEPVYAALAADLKVANVNMSSAAGRHGYAFRTPYSSAKFGVIGLTQSLAKELGPQNIRVNAILPGIVEGSRMDGVIHDRAQQLGVSDDEMKQKYVEKISLRRMVNPYDVAAMVAFLLSDAGANVSGQSLGVDGNVETL